MKLVKIAFGIFMIGAVWACSSSGSQEGAEQSVAAEPEETETMPVEMTQMEDPGKAVYGQYCVACHQTDGKGMSGVFPPLTQTKWIEGDKTELISVILNGLQGAITVNGEEYNNVMPSHGFLSDEDIAAVLTYVRQSFGNSAGEITTAEVTQVRGSAGSGNATQ